MKFWVEGKSMKKSRVTVRGGLTGFLLAGLIVLPCAAQEKVRFPIGESSKTLSYGPLWIAKKQGFFDQQGLDVPIITMRGTPLTLQALTAESIYIANATTDGIIAAVERGADLAMIGGLLNNLGLSMIGGKRYKTYRDLRGTTIGTQTLTAGTGFALRLVLKAHGLEFPRDYNLLHIGSAPDRYTALQSGQISAAPVGVPLDVTAKQQGFNVIGYFADDLPNYQFNVYGVKRSWAEKNRPLVVRFMKAMVLATRWLMDNPEPACNYLSKEMAINPEHCRLGWEYNVKKRIWDRNADLNVEGVRTMINIYAEQNNLREPLPQPAKYIDPSYLKQALAEVGRK
jgi:ABC-type nitrate/sulfonate/bicarbonate transport system substrate-binding protein